MLVLSLIFRCVVGDIRLLKQDVDPGTFLWSQALVGSLDEFINVVVGDLNVQVLGVSTLVFEPKEVLSLKGDGIFVYTRTVVLNASGTIWGGSTLDSEVAALSATTVVGAPLGG